jgi:zinc protease
LTLPTCLARALVALVLVAAPCLAAENTAERELANGMRVIVKPDRRAPVAVVMVWYRVGSIDEVNGTTGVAHVLEHMMFKGTATTPAGEYSRIIAAAGGRENAFTSNDYTGYFATLNKSKLDLMFGLEADRMDNLAFSPEEFAKELKVVMEERRMRT